MDKQLFIKPKDLSLKITTQNNLKIIDATFYLPNSDFIAKNEYDKKHIPNAVFFDINNIADPYNSLPHMIPSKELFSEMMTDLGLNNEDDIVIYDNSPLLSSARAWFLFRYFGFENISILPGGLNNWTKSGGEVTDKITFISKGNFTANIERKELVISLDQMINASKNVKSIILDARSYKRFTGEANEPRPGLPSGHIPSSKSLPSSDIINNEGYLKSLDELNLIFSKNKVSTNDEIVATCGSGVSACVIALAHFFMGKSDVKIYDGSWSEWASSGQEIVKGKE
ncbi:sulfurtransferase [Alphaproteobacteria bacterium]|nr:sulfurtransferase [Alphaproteobacteria bacterium]